MSNKLGRGLEALGVTELLSDLGLGGQLAQEVVLRNLPIEKILPGRFQPRRHFDEASLNELAESIKQQGIIQPIVVRRQGDKYELIAGERRWRAAQRANLLEIPAIVRELTDNAALAIALIENIQRQDLNIIEEAQAINRLILEFQLTHEQAADAVGKTRSTVSNLLRLLKLHPDVRELVEQNKLEMGHARALLALEPHYHLDAAMTMLDKQMNARQAEALVKQLQSPSPLPTQKIATADPDIKSLETKLGDQLGAKVLIQADSKGRGKLTIHYNSLDELEGILEHIK